MTIANSSLIHIVRKALSEKYSNIHPFTEEAGGTRATFLADWGIGEKKKTRMIKIDTMPKSPRAIRHVERGCTSRNDLDALLAVENPDSHFITRLCDFEDLAAHGHQGILVVEEYFPSRSLQRMVAERPLSLEQFEQVMEKVFHASQYLLKELGMYHRDLSPSNILVQEKKDGSLDVRVTDLANTKRRDETRAKPIPTAGAHFISDPLLMSQFTNVDRSYTEQAEIYALGKDMLFALTGKHMVECDPDKGTIIAYETGETLLDVKGRVNKQRYEEVLAATLTMLDHRGKRYEEIMGRCLTLEESDRYASIDDLIADFKTKKKPTFGERVKKSWKSITAFAAAGLITISAVGSLWYSTEKKNRDLEARLAEEKPYRAASEWNGETLEITNSLVDLKPSVYIHHRQYPEQSYLEGNPGDSINGYILVQERPRLKEGGYRMLPPFSAKIYLEGFAGKALYVRAHPHNLADAYDGQGYLGGDINSYNIPQEIGNGLRYLIIELHSPVNEEGYEKIQFHQGNHIIARKRIPVKVGSVKNTTEIKSLRFGLAPFISLGKMEEKYGTNHNDVQTEVSFPGEDYQEITGSGYISNLPRPQPNDQKILQIIMRSTENGEIVNYTYVPLEARTFNDSSGWWEFAIPGKDFSEKIQHYRAQLFHSKYQSK